MKVLHVLHTSLPYIAGYCIRSDQIIRNTAQLGCQSVVVTSAQHPNAGEDPELIGDVRHYRTAKRDVSGLPILREFGLMNLLHQRISEVIELEQPDLIHAHSPVLVGYPALRAARRAGLPIVYEVRDLWENALVDRGRFGSRSPMYQAARRFETYLLNRVDHVVTISEQLAAEVRSRRTSGTGVTTIGNGVDISELTEELSSVAPAEMGFQNDWPVLGYIGTFQPYEGLRTLMDAYLKLRQQGHQLNLAIIGGGGEEVALKDYAQKLGLQNEIYMPGKVPKDTVPSFYRAIDVFAYPRIDSATTRLTTPLKPLEAMVADRFVCVSDLPAMRELVDDGTTGVVFQSMDTSSLSAAVERALCNPETTSAMVRSAARWVRDHRDWKELAKGYGPVYEACVAGTEAGTNRAA
ncbi:MAG: glycosyltransferase family 4 protein [Pseudomonadota bacterium]